MTTNRIAGSYGNYFVLFLTPYRAGRWEGGSKGEDICILFAAVCRKQQNSVKQLSFNKKLII